jgi:glycosyltransferase involved in cell wall biosynthesis
VSEHVQFLGYQAGLAEVYAGSDMAVLSSDNEGTPVSLIEAAAAGLPALATDVGGVSEVVRGSTGRLVPKGDHERMAVEMIDLARSAELRRKLGGVARTHVIPRYSADRLIADVEALYQDLLRTRTRGCRPVCAESAGS